MPRLISGSQLRSGGSNTFINLTETQPQFPPDADQTTGYTISTNNKFITTTTNTLGNIVHAKGFMYPNLTNTNLVLSGTGTGVVVVEQYYVSSSTTSGALVVNGGIGVGANMIVAQDIIVAGITIGQGFQGQNNVVLVTSTATETSDLNEGFNNVAIGWGALTGLSSANKAIAIGRRALASGTNISNSIAIGDNALAMLGTLPSWYVTPIIDVIRTDPVQVVADGHGLTTGTAVKITGVVGSVELNGNTYYVSVLDSNTVALYTDNILNNPLLGGSLSTYIHSGVLTRVALSDSNFALGGNAGFSLRDGEQNFIFGDQTGINLTTGSGNVLIGHNIGDNLTHGNDNISIMGPNLVDGVDNQINIGSIFYYNGDNLLDLNTDVTLGFGTNSTSPITGALTVDGGVGITDNLYIGGITNIVNSANSTATNNGALIVAGGAGIQGNLNLGSGLTALGAGGINLSPAGSDVVIEPRVGGSVRIFPSTTGTLNAVVIGSIMPEDGNFLRLNSLDTTNAISSTTGAFTVAGGAGIAKDLYVGGRIIGPAAATLAATATNIFINATSASVYSLTLDNAPLSYSNTGSGQLYSTATLTFDAGLKQLQTPTLSVTSTLTDTATNINQAFTVTGGAYVGGGIYSPVSGNPNENNLVYTPQIYVTTSTPVSARVGDFWINPNFGVELQYIADGTNLIWIQFTGF
jgi:hypothetical protein